MRRLRFGSVLAAANSCDAGEFPATFAAQSGLKVTCSTDAGVNVNHIEIHDADNAAWHHGAAHSVALTPASMPPSERPTLVTVTDDGSLLELSATLAQAAAMIKTQAHCRIEDAVALMQVQAEVTARTIEEIGSDLIERLTRFGEDVCM